MNQSTNMLFLKCSLVKGREKLIMKNKNLSENSAVNKTMQCLINTAFDWQVSCFFLVILYISEVSRSPMSTCKEFTNASSLFSMGLNSSFFFSRSLMSGLAALISILRLAVGVHGSTCGCLSTSFTGVMGFLSGVKILCFDRSIGSFFIGVFGVILDRSTNIFSCLERRELLARLRKGRSQLWLQSLLHWDLAIQTDVQGWKESGLDKWKPESSMGIKQRLWGDTTVSATPFTHIFHGVSVREVTNVSVTNSCS